MQEAHVLRIDQWECFVMQNIRPFANTRAPSAPAMNPSHMSTEWSTEITAKPNLVCTYVK